MLKQQRRGGSRLDSVGVNGGIDGDNVSGNRLLVLLHLVVVLKIAIILLIILVDVGGVLFGGLGEIDDLATSAGGDHVVQVDGVLGVSLVLIIVVLGFRKYC